MRRIVILLIFLILIAQMRKHVRFLLITSYSMYPVMNAGDMVISIRKSQYAIHDIVTYKTQHDTYVTHRIVSKNHDVVITKGDANNTLDTPIELDDIQGKVIFVFEMPTIFRRI